MAERPTQKFDAHITKKSKAKSWMLLFLLLGVPLGTLGGGYWFQSSSPRLVESIRAKDVMAPFSAWSLGRKGEANHAEEELKSLVTDQTVSSYLRRGAASAVGTLKDPDCTRFLDDAARNDPDPEVRAAACAALAASGVENAEPTIEYVLVNDTETSPLAAACKAAGDLGLARQTSVLIDNLGTTDYRVRTAAREALVIFYPAGETFGDDMGRWRAWYQEQ